MFILPVSPSCARNRRLLFTQESLKFDACENVPHVDGEPGCVMAARVCLLACKVTAENGALDVVPFSSSRATKHSKSIQSSCLCQVFPN